MRFTRLTCVLIVLLLPGCLSRETSSSSGNPALTEVSLTASNGWEGRLLYEGDSGIWAVRSVQLFPRFGCPEIIGLDDRGRCTVLVSYSGKWTPMQTVQDGAWLGALAHVDLDPHRKGPELYVGGRGGNLYQIHPRETGGFDANIIAHFPGQELHTIIGGVLQASGGNELLVFMRSGEVHKIVAPHKLGGHFRMLRLAEMPGRVRDAVLLPPSTPGSAPRIMVATRAQKVILLTKKGEELAQQTILDEPMGFGRIARKRRDPGAAEVVYVSRDDGVILRLEESASGSWTREIIYVGPQGPRGVISGRFSADPTLETVAVFGYSKKVELLSRTPGQPWSIETIFVDRDKGHWLTVTEVDGRNSTDEIVGSGYGRRIFLLKRPPGYGLEDVPTESRRSN